MNILIVYDSYFGNTEKIAAAIANALKDRASVRACRTAEFKLEDLSDLDYLLVGSPTRGFRPSDATKAFLNALPAAALKSIKTAAFDTRVSARDINNPLLNVLARIFGYAASPIANQLSKKGGVPAGAPEGFFVNGTEGPLKDGEIERAAAWAGSIVKP